MLAVSQPIRKLSIKNLNSKTHTELPSQMNITLKILCTTKEFSEEAQMQQWLFLQEIILTLYLMIEKKELKQKLKLELLRQKSSLQEM